MQINQRELIKMDKQEISMDRIAIETEHTIFCKISRQEFPNIQELEKEVKELRKELKNNNVSLGKTSTLKILKNSSEEYNSLVKEYNKTFDNLTVAWSNKIHVGVYTGYIDDEYINEVIRPLEHKLTKMNYVGCLLSTMKDIQRKVKNYKEELNHGICNYEKIWL